MTDPAQPNPGRKLISEQGEYELGDLIGKGGMGSVYEVTRRGMLYGARVAKLLHCALALSKDARDALLKEAQIAFQIVHPNLVAVTDIGMIGDAPFLVMERVDGVNLRDFLEAVEKPVPIPVALFIIGEVAAGLEALHDRKIGEMDAGIVHSDVTPRNILISSEGFIKLTDFGIARFAHNDATRSRPIGTPLYMSPEQRLGKTPRATDLFSLGKIGWELLEGGDKHYLADFTELQRTEAMLNGYIPPFTRPDIPEYAVILCRRMLAPNPEDRPLARQVREIIIDKELHYVKTAKKIAELYKEHIGPKRTGMTKLLNTADFFREKPPESSPIKITLDSSFSAPSAAPNERTVAESGEDDAPAVFRRNRTSPGSPRADSLSTRVTHETGTANPMRLGLFGPPRSAEQEPPSLLPPLLVHEPEPEPSPPPALALVPSSDPALDSAPYEPEPEVEATMLLDPPFAESSQPEQMAVPIEQAPTISQPMVAVPIEQAPTISQPIAVGFPAAPVTEVRGRNAALWVLSGMVGLLVIMLVVVVAVVLSVNRRDETTTTTPSSVAEQGGENKEGPKPEIATGPESIEPREAEVEPPPVDPPPVEPATVDPATVDPATEDPPKTDTEKKPKAVKTVNVTFYAPDKDAKVKVGRTTKTGSLVDFNLALGSSHSVSWWRSSDDRKVYEVGKFKVTEPPAGKAHLVKLSPTDMKIEEATQGSAGQ